ncbi:transcription termination factor MTEF18, mitochondrial-like [Rosa rugosa]|uniref:transcription termination factor MTEF18, mitochondrial-like n=1 Tax=Rosa rugosa TaxID=74645 RepID=UPI002B40D2C5|nr:transcription termination factor MTEF18, mitochondrial-like [Rosa rugosa]
MTNLRVSDNIGFFRDQKFGSWRSNTLQCFCSKSIASNTISSEISKQANFRVTYLTNSCRLPPEDAKLAASKVELQSQKGADSVLALLSSHGLSETQISKLVKSHPRVLLADPEKTLSPKIEFFSSVGLSREDLARVLSFNPHLLSSSLENQIVPSYNFLRNMISKENVVAVLKRRSWMFLENHSRNVMPNIEALREPRACISLLLAYDTQVLMHNDDELVQLVNEVKGIGFDLKKSTFVVALRALCGKSSRAIWNRNREIHKRSWGWPDDDVISAFRKSPQCMMLSEKKIMRTMDFLVNKMGWYASMIPTYPVILCFSLENRIIPRCSVVKVLMKKGLVDEKLSLAYALLPAEKQFLERFVTRYLSQVPNLLSVYEGELDLQDV